MIFKQYTQSGIKEYISKYPEYKNDKIWLERLITYEELTEMNKLLKSNQIKIDIDNHILDTYYARIINQFLEEHLPPGNICSLASGLGDREHWLLDNSKKERVFHVSDLYTSKILNDLEFLLNQKFNKKCFSAFKKPINQIKLPYENRKFDGAMSIGSINLLNNEDVERHINEMLRVLKNDGVGVLCCYQFLSPIRILSEIVKKFIFRPRTKYSKHYAFARDINQIKSILFSKIDKNNLAITKFLYKDTMVNNLIGSIPLIGKIYVMLNFGIVMFVFKKT